MCRAFGIVAINKLHAAVIQLAVVKIVGAGRHGERMTGCGDSEQQTEKPHDGFCAWPIVA